jgi:hypothetical protein
VLGYQGDPYLRIGAAGVFQNIHSPALYQNRLLPPGAPATTLPAIARAAAAPQWQKISSSHTATWRDRRTRWEGPRPAVVQQEPHRVTAAPTGPSRCAKEPSPSSWKAASSGSHHPVRGHGSASPCCCSSSP